VGTVRGGRWREEAAGWSRARGRPFRHRPLSTSTHFGRVRAVVRDLFDDRGHDARATPLLHGDGRALGQAFVEHRLGGRAGGRRTRARRLARDPTALDPPQPARPCLRPPPGGRKRAGRESALAPPAAREQNARRSPRRCVPSFPPMSGCPLWWACCERLKGGWREGGGGGGWVARPALLAAAGAARPPGRARAGGSGGGGRERRAGAHLGGRAREKSVGRRAARAGSRHTSRPRFCPPPSR